MNLLLDTHTPLWLLLKDNRLPRETARTIVDRSNTVFVSAISGFEIATKVSLGKLPGANGFPAPSSRSAPTSTSSNCRSTTPMR